jgi:hypothetical protein
MAKKGKKLGVVKGDNKQPTEVKEVPMGTTEQQPPKQYEYADLVFECSCGFAQILKTGHPGNQAISIPILPQEGSGLSLGCEKCKTRVGLRFVQSSKEDIVKYRAEAAAKVKEEEDKKYAEDAERIKQEKEDESVRESSETEQVAVGVSDGDKQPVESNS